jgi:hypothetical protein
MLLVTALERSKPLRGGCAGEGWELPEVEGVVKTRSQSIE